MYKHHCRHKAFIIHTIFLRYIREIWSIIGNPFICTLPTFSYLTTYNAWPIPIQELPKEVIIPHIGICIGDFIRVCTLHICINSIRCLYFNDVNRTHFRHLNHPPARIICHSLLVRVQTSRMNMMCRCVTTVLCDHRQMC
jgi:hypothetical protein